MVHVNIFDTTLRDGEQSPGVNLNQPEKLEIAKQLEKLGVNMMEAGFPASSHGDFEAVRAIARSIKNASVAGMARAVKSDIDIAWEALKVGQEPRLHIFLATSPIHMQYKLNKSPEEVIQLAVETVSYARKVGFPHVEFSAEDASRSDLDYLAKIVEKIIDAGVTVVNLPDTVGYATPEEYGHLFRYIKENVPNIDKAVLSAHCHDDLGMSVANTLAALQNGATQAEGTINGIGERAGNAALEEFAVALNIRKDKYPFTTDLVLNEIKRTSDLVSKLTGMSIAPNKAIIGKNAFAHESGIHQDGVLKNAATYEIITPELIGLKSNHLVLGKHSGRHAFNEKIEQIGFSLSAEKLNEAFQTFKRLTDRKKEVTDEDLFTILTDIQTNSVDIKKYELVSFQVQYDSFKAATAVASLKTPEGGQVEASGSGQGSVEALYNAMESLVKEEIHVKTFNLSSIGQGRDALVDVNVNMTVNGVAASGRGSAQDLIEASAKAFLNAVNRLFLRQNAAQIETS